MNSQGIIVSLSTQERSAILAQVPLPKGVDTRLRFAVHGAAGVEVRLDDDDFEAFIRALLVVLSETDDMALADVLTGVLTRIHPLAPDEIPEEFDRALFPPEIPDEICQQIHGLLRSGEFESLEDAYEAVQALLERHNDAPLDALLGLSLDQVYRLLYSGWNAPESVLHIRDDIPEADLAGSCFLHNALVFLRALEEEGGAKLTPKKNLNQKFVARMRKETTWVAYQDRLNPDYCPGKNEEDAWPVHILRILLEAARLARVYKGKLQVTKLGRQCLAPACAGALQAQLFTALGTEFNLAYLDRAQELIGVQDTYPFILYALGQIAREPALLETVCQRVFLPDVAIEFVDSGYRSESMAVLDTRVLWPLCDFGLVQLTPEHRTHGKRETPRYAQVTPLFSKMIEFDFDRELGPG